LYAGGADGPCWQLLSPGYEECEADDGFPLKKKQLKKQQTKKTKTANPTIPLSFLLVIPLSFVLVFVLVRLLVAWQE